MRIIPKHGHAETQLAYVHPKFLESTEFTGYIAPVVEEVETIDQSHVGVDFKWKLGKGVFFVSPKPFEYKCKYGPTYETTSMSGYITSGLKKALSSITSCSLEPLRLFLRALSLSMLIFILPKL